MGKITLQSSSNGSTSTTMGACSSAFIVVVEQALVHWARPNSNVTLSQME